MRDFKELNLKPQLVEALRRINFVTMTEVQEKAIPEMLEGKDVIVRAKTGTGKTGAFLVPIFERIRHENNPSAIVLAPTRELALQVTSVAEQLGRSMHLGVVTVYGGASINVQISRLQRHPDVIVGTPGRIIDLMERGALRLEGIKYFIMDEADIMLDMGFIEDVEYIIQSTPKHRQTMLFSATMPRQVVDIARKYMKSDTLHVTVGAEEDVTVNTISHAYFFAGGRAKFSAMLAYIKQFNPRKCIIFSSTKHESNVIHEFLQKQGFNAILLHGGLTQAMRERSLSSFKAGAQFLIATNIASRGLDIANVTDVINFDAPEDPRVYVHRVGRSARMGKEGRAFTIFSPDQRGLMNAIRQEANIDMKELHLNVDEFANVEVPRSSFRRSFGRPFNRDRGGGGGHRFGHQQHGGGGRFDHGRKRYRRGYGL